MNIISCDTCGVLIDLNKRGFPDSMLDDTEGVIDPDKGEWNGETYVRKMYCPVCESPILEQES